MKKSVLITGASGSLRARLISAATASGLEVFAGLYSAIHVNYLLSYSLPPTIVKGAAGTLFINNSTGNLYNYTVEIESLLIKSFLSAVTKWAYILSDNFCIQGFTGWAAYRYKKLNDYKI